MAEVNRPDLTNNHSVPLSPCMGECGGRGYVSVRAKVKYCDHSDTLTPNRSHWALLSLWRLYVSKQFLTKRATYGAIFYLAEITLHPLAVFMLYELLSLGNQRPAFSLHKWQFAFSSTACSVWWLCSSSLQLRKQKVTDSSIFLYAAQVTIIIMEVCVAC